MFKLGEEVVIQSTGTVGSKWTGLRCIIAEVDCWDEHGGTLYEYYLTPLDDRPDGHGRAMFYWETEELVRAVPEIPTPETYEVD